MKKLKVAKKSATPQAFPSLVRKSLAVAVVKVAKRSKPRKLPKKAVVTQINANARFPQISAASALLDLHKLRTAGTWVRCRLQHCGKWRKLQEKDPSQVRSHMVCFVYHNYYDSLCQGVVKVGMQKESGCRLQPVLYARTKVVTWPGVGAKQVLRKPFQVHL